MSSKEVSRQVVCEEPGLMRDYGKVHTSFWTSENIRSLSEDGRTFAMYLLTCEHGTIAGVFGFLMAMLATTYNGVSKGFRKVCRNSKQTVSQHAVSALNGVCSSTLNGIVQRILTSANLLKRLQRECPSECSWRLDFAEFLQNDPSGRAKKQNPSETVSEPFLNQEQEQEQEQDNKNQNSKRGSRLPSDWKPSDEDLQFCKTERPEQTHAPLLTGSVITGWLSLALKRTEAGLVRHMAQLG